MKDDDVSVIDLDALIDAVDETVVTDAAELCC